MRREAGVRLHRIGTDDPGDQPDHHGEHDAVDDDRVPDAPEHPPVHQHQREREQHHRQRGEEVGRRGRVLERMGGVHAVEAAPVRAEHLDRDDRGHRADHNRLGLRLALVVEAHRARLEGGGYLRAGEGHRHALLHEDDAENQRDRHIDVNGDAPHIDEEVADRRFAAEGADDCGERAEADRGREEHVRQDEKGLAEIRERLVARIMLQIGVGHKGYDRVEDRRRLEHAQAARVQRRDRLEAEHDEAEDEQRDVEDDERDRVLLPVLRTGVDQILKPFEDTRRAVAAVHQPGEIGAERDRAGNRRQDQQCGKKPHGCCLSHLVRARRLQRTREIEQSGRRPTGQNHSGRISAVTR